MRVGPEDVERISTHLGMTPSAFRSRYVAVTGDRLAEGLGNRCVFLADGSTARCTIYAVRPERCRSWPFWEEHRDPEALAEAARLCPGIALSAEPGGPQRRNRR